MKGRRYRKNVRELREFIAKLEILSIVVILEIGRFWLYLLALTFRIGSAGKDLILLST
jgi:hypothetical protein